MKYAASIRFGGQLVDAEDCGYEDYKNLQLLCPNCKEPVFLQGAFIRQGKTKESYVSPHFKHFPFVDAALVRECESRVAKYDQKEVQRRAAIARNQRLKTLQRYFWTLFLNNCKTLKKEGNPPGAPQIFDEWINDFLSKHIIKLSYSIFESEEEGHLFCRKYLDGINLLGIIQDKQDNQKMRVMASGVAKRTIKSAYTAGINYELHLEILEEVFDFLHSKSSRNLLLKCLVFGLMRAIEVPEVWTWFKKALELDNRIEYLCYTSFCRDICEVNWAKVLSNSQNYLIYKSTHGDESIMCKSSNYEVNSVWHLLLYDGCTPFVEDGRKYWRCEEFAPVKQIKSDLESCIKSIPRIKSNAEMNFMLKDCMRDGYHQDYAFMIVHDSLMGKVERRMFFHDERKALFKDLLQ